MSVHFIQIIDDGGDGEITDLGTVMSFLATPAMSFVL
jgi:hypothetical protein